MHHAGELPAADDSDHWKVRIARYSHALQDIRAGGGVGTGVRGGGARPDPAPVPAGALAECG
ncbi:hypothetical protein Kpho01_20550 [Kitasatospora phosalacinea]|uniref:Uncharacterized protein n=1 Tax=Kitasatospora phosalacinea TaxID=2065 RepID=A0A9W6UMR7_9ACTN|nr:hypothetical protein Kpho01_20550 [Kitasatospora phosalacinea]